MSQFPTSSRTVETLAETIRQVAEAEPRLAGVYLFGSRATEEAHDSSDIDLGALFSSPVDVWEQLGIQARLEETLARCTDRAEVGRADIDLVDLGSASAFLALDVVRGERLYCRDVDFCDDFELYVLRRAGDLAPFERQRRELILGQREGETK